MTTPNAHGHATENTPRGTAAAAAAGPGDGPAPLNTWQATTLVAEREITTQVRSKSFVIGLIITLVLIVGGIVLTNVFGGNDSASDVAVESGIEIPDAAQEGTPLPGASGIEPVDAADRESAEQMLRDGEVEAAIVTNPDHPTGMTVIGLDAAPADIAQSLSVSPDIEVLDPGDQDEGLRFIVAILFGLVFMILSMGSGTMIVQNTVQEKQSRIVEILLSSISARALLGGKVLGNSVIAVGQAILYAAASAGALLVMGQGGLLDTLTWPMLWFVLFFVPGFLLVASMFAASGALVSRQEDAGSVMTPTMMLVMAPYMLVVFFNTNTTVMAVASYIPFSAPVAMPLRMFFGDAQWFEPLLALGILLATAALVMLLAARIYSRSLLHTGQRMKLTSALRAKG